MYSSLCLSGTKTPAEPSQIALCGTGCEGKMKEGCCVQHRMRSSLLDILFYKGLEESRGKEGRNRKSGFKKSVRGTGCLSNSLSVLGWEFVFLSLLQGFWLTSPQKCRPLKFSKMRPPQAVADSWILPPRTCLWEGPQPCPLPWALVAFSTLDLGWKFRSLCVPDIHDLNLFLKVRSRSSSGHK